MASTKIRVHNDTSDQLIACCYTVGEVFLVSSAGLNPNSDADLPCEWVWYDIVIRKPNSQSDECKKKGVYANSTLHVQKKDNTYYFD